MFIEFHAIQNFAPSNLNRDDTNNPKDCVFGNVRRARISSQCLKRSIRFEPSFAEETKVPAAQRTKLILPEIRAELINLGLSEEEASTKASEFVEKYCGKLDSKNPDKTAVLLFTCQQEIKEIAEGITTETDIKKFADIYAKKNSGRTSAPDIALYGRMLADRPEANVDAACQVAHAISTHAVNMDMDFFTAIDDLQPDAESGAGMMGVVGFNSACFYRYACVDFDQLVKNLSGDRELAEKTLRAFLHASVNAIPSGKQNSFAANNPPSFLMTVVRENAPCVSLANAFEMPVRPKARESLTAKSIEAMCDYYQRMESFFGTAAMATVVNLEPAAKLDTLNAKTASTLEEWIDTTITEIRV